MLSYSIIVIFFLQLCIDVRSAPTSSVPDFVKQAGQQATKEFQSIMSNKSLTYDQQDEALSQWAGKYNVADQLTKLKEASAEKRKVHNDKVNDVLAQLPEFKKQIDEILAERDTAKGDIDKKINEISQKNKRVNCFDF
ncbi:hypothetical protein WR25_19786 isoform B [Diploscapter pachys]|uniref:SXP/RAL-2 family protein Ani s 5-like cation-binding domain-containing protein n=1 Tax=Diploscapter pachys TaxID=2018661 RepID=A0A2A2JDN3_9BILA|nr:hypothetical protein WR25_19786 isoform B [Diploscapter pachys]